MSDSFMHGFADELTKTAGHPLFQTVTQGAATLGKKVRATAMKAVKAGKKFKRGLSSAPKAKNPPKGMPRAKLKKKAEELVGADKKNTVGGPAVTGLKPPPPPPPPKPVTTKIPKIASEEYGDEADEAGRALADMLAQSMNQQPSGGTVPMGVSDPTYESYGTGRGNFKGRKAPAFTSSTKGGKIGNPTENPDRFGTGCGKTAGIGSKLLLGTAAIPMAAALGTIAREETKGKKKPKAPAVPREGWLPEKLLASYRKAKTP